MKLTREFRTGPYSTKYIWSAIVEGEELCYQVSVDEYGYNRVPIHVLESQARAAIIGAIEKKLFGE